MAINSSEDLLVHELSDLLSAENQFAKALQKVAKAADSDVVRQMAEEHREQTLQHAENVKQALSAMGKKPERGVVCKAAQGLVTEADETIKEEKPKGALKDVALIGGCLRIEHYEIAGYTGAIAAAKSLGQREVVKLLQSNLKDEQATAKKLTVAGPEFLKAAQASDSDSGDGGQQAATPTKAGGGSRGATKSRGGAKAKS